MIEHNEGQTPGQAEMETVERYIEEFKEIGVWVMLRKAMQMLLNETYEEVVHCATEVTMDPDTQIRRKAKLRRIIASVQVACDMAELVVGDTAEETCEVLAAMQKLLQGTQKE